MSLLIHLKYTLFLIHELTVQIEYSRRTAFISMVFTGCLLELPDWVLYNIYRKWHKVPVYLRVVTIKYYHNWQLAICSK